MELWRRFKKSGNCSYEWRFSPGIGSMPNSARCAILIIDTGRNWIINIKSCNKSPAIYSYESLKWPCWISEVRRFWSLIAPIEKFSAWPSLLKADEHEELAFCINPTNWTQNCITIWTWKSGNLLMRRSDEKIELVCTCLIDHERTHFFANFISFENAYLIVIMA